MPEPPARSAAIGVRSGVVALRPHPANPPSPRGAPTSPSPARLAERPAARLADPFAGLPAPSFPERFADDAALARAAAVDAARILLDLRTMPRPPGDAGTRLLCDAADAAAHRVVLDRVLAERPHDVVFSEEAPDPRRRLAASRVWIVDPLDGTREFGVPGRDDWAVHVALWADGDLVAAAVALPARGEVYGTHGEDRPGCVPAGCVPAGCVPAGVVPAGLARPGPAAPSRRAVPRIAVSRSRPPAVAAELAEALGAELVPMGSAGAKCAAVWRGEVDAYVHTGTLHEWDVAAPAAVARAAGLHVSRLHGEPPVFNRRTPVVPDLVVCVPELAEPILEGAARHVTEVIS